MRFRASFRAIIVAVLAFTAASWTNDAQACQCMVPPSVEEAVDAAEHVFTGSASHRLVVGDHIVTQFVVGAIFKGEVIERMAVVSNGYRCGWRFTVGESYLVYADTDVDGAPDVGPFVQDCDRTCQRQHGDGDLAKFSDPIWSAPGRVEDMRLTDETLVMAARLATREMTIPEDVEPIIERSETAYIITFPMTLPPHTRGGDYHARVTFDAATGTVSEVLGAP